MSFLPESAGFRGDRPPQTPIEQPRWLPRVCLGPAPIPKKEEKRKTQNTPHTSLCFRNRTLPLASLGFDVQPARGPGPEALKMCILTDTGEACAAVTPRPLWAWPGLAWALGSLARRPAPTGFTLRCHSPRRRSRRPLRHASNKQQMLKGFVFSPPKSCQGAWFTWRPGLGGPLRLPGTVCMEQGVAWQVFREGCRGRAPVPPGLCLGGTSAAPQVQGPSPLGGPVLPVGGHPCLGTPQGGHRQRRGGRNCTTKVLFSCKCSQRFQERCQWSSAVPGSLERRPFF